MKKIFGILTGIIALCAAFSAAGCAAQPETAADGGRGEISSSELPGREEALPQEGEMQPSIPSAPYISPLAALDGVNVASAFPGAREDGGFALRAAGSTEYFCDFKWTSEISGKEKFYSGLGLGLSLDDVIGLRPSSDGSEGITLYGGGSAGFSLDFVGPQSDSEPYSKSFEAGFKHDGGLIVFAGENGAEEQVLLPQIKDELAKTAGSGVLEGIAQAVETIPENLKKGASFRFAVEKLIDLGFAAEIDDSDGLTVHLVAGHAFYTGLLNDLVEEIMPAEWAEYIPTLDISYTSCDFEITVAFGADGLFKEYSFTSDSSLSLSLEIPRLFRCESGVQLSGGMSVSAYYGEIPA